MYSPRKLPNLDPTSLDTVLADLYSSILSGTMDSRRPTLLLRTPTVASRQVAPVSGKLFLRRVSG